MTTRFRGKLVAFFFGGVLGALFGVALGFFFFPFVFPPPPASEQLSEADLMLSQPGRRTQRTSAPSTARIGGGTFLHANPSDPIHWGRGKVSLYPRAVFLESDFEVGPGPAFHVYLVPKASIRSSADMKDVMYVDLGRLRSFKGSQRYQIPEGVNLKDYSSVVIWCERFGVLISPADLQSVQATN